VLYGRRSHLAVTATGAQCTVLTAVANGYIYTLQLSLE